MYYNKSIKEILDSLKTSKKGLSLSEVKKRLKKYGFNQLKRTGEKTSRIKIFLFQWKNPLIIILLIAGTISGFLGEIIDMTIIFITAGINGVIGFVQEDKANQALSKLRSLVSYKALVVRDGKKIQIDSEKIVPGDILLLSNGDKVQADGRLITCRDLYIDEAALTGESEIIAKHVHNLKVGTILADRKNMVYRGTTVSAGEGEMVVTSTGHETEIGKIATLVGDIDEQITPLQLQLGKLSKVIGLIIVVVSFLIIGLGLLVAGDTYSLLELFETSVAVAVAAIPEGLVISLTVILAIGMQHILTRKALVRKLVAAETLGSVSVICTDKTGTLTEGKMRVNSIITADGELGVSNKIAESGILALNLGVLCNDAVHQNPEAKQASWKFIGTPTETSLLKAGARVGILQDKISKINKRIDVLPFDSKHKYMATLNTDPKGSFIAVKGAPEILLAKSTNFQINGKSIKMTEAKRKELSKKQIEISQAGLRLLAVGYRACGDNKLTRNKINNLTFVGLIVIADPLRNDVKSTILASKKAGIHVVMITGDHVKTAQSIAKSLELPCREDQLLEGAQLERMNEGDLQLAIKKIHVFARVDPKHKIRIVKAFQANGDVVAMTGDGVNDAPALKGADIGVALGSGTDVAKEVADMVLLNDSFSTIVAAIEEGRRIYQNIKKEVLYLMIGSFTEVVLIAGSLIARLPLALLPAQILWTNIVQESLPTMALAFDPGDKENMTDPPRKKDVSIFDDRMKVMLVMFTVVVNVFLFGIFLYYMTKTGDIARARSLMLVGIGVDSLLYIYSIRSMRHHFWKINPFNNHYLTASVLFGWVLLILAIYTKPLQVLLRTVPLPTSDWAIMIGFGILTVLLIEAMKSFYTVKTNYKSHSS
jgi:P-type Ca2+ transporter type 2C